MWPTSGRRFLGQQLRYVETWNIGLLAAAAARVRGVLDDLFDRFTGFASEFLNPADQFFLFAFHVLKVAIRELGPLLLQLAFGDVPVPFSFECRHNSM